MNTAYISLRAFEGVRIAAATEHGPKGRIIRVTVFCDDYGNGASIELATADAMILCAKLQEAIAHKPETVEAS